MIVSNHLIIVERCSRRYIARQGEMLDMPNFIPVMDMTAGS